MVQGLYREPTRTRDVCTRRTVYCGHCTVTASRRFNIFSANHIAPSSNLNLNSDQNDTGTGGADQIEFIAFDERYFWISNYIYSSLGALLS